MNAPLRQFETPDFSPGLRKTPLGVASYKYAGPPTFPPFFVFFGRRAIDTFQNLLFQSPTIRVAEAANPAADKQTHDHKRMVISVDSNPLTGFCLLNAEQFDENVEAVLHAPGRA